jgi:hypothetical protein
MHPLWIIIGALLVAAVLWDAFETVVLPRRVRRKFRIARFFYRSTWIPWRAVAARIVPRRTRESFLSMYGPLSLLVLLGVWAAGLVLGFAVLHYGAGSTLLMQGEPTDFRVDLYLSGTTFFTLGLGDVVPRNTVARVLTVLESGMGFGFLALVIGYLPVIYQGFSRRELTVLLLDARAGSPPTAAELLRRHASTQGLDAFQQLLRDFERWSAEVLESHISYPVLGYFRSQHANQSWLAALSVLLDATSLVIVGVDDNCTRQAQLTFAMARHVVVDLAQIFNAPPREPSKDRLSSADLKAIRKELSAAGLHFREGERFEERLRDFRTQYEPYVNSLARFLRISVPPWISHTKQPDNWQTSAWGRISGFDAREITEPVADDHL